VTLTCPRQTSAHYKENLYWIRLVSGNLPQFLGVLFNFMDVSKIPRIQTKQNGEQFHLHINDAQQNDTGLYYCIKVRQLDFIFISGTFVKIKGEESDVNVVLQKHPSVRVHPVNPGTLQCSVLSKSDWSTCPADNRVYWFRAGSDDSHPNFLYLQEISKAECERSPGVPSAQTCFYNFSEISDAGTYYCAVAACGQILFGNGAKIKGIQKDFSNIVLSSLISALVISLAIISCLIYKIKKKTCSCCKGHTIFLIVMVQIITYWFETLICIFSLSINRLWLLLYCSYFLHKVRPIIFYS
uniref:Ig-like domain-containing protein n=1 Tax=Cyprinodon variegatus TaxID=28743 RepID=A0A3Q2E3D1_CYPVA